ncbi:glycosyltransferase family 39 protein [Mangrovibacterium marinum]|uniref:4-amino-4-deoxy-L-arabinose transferase-like glycosyltransferase n=1 Tax=Mangrovibacterium marinum TaxID=1639118 RepID=A0A2T5C222_9BACT|nr:glycosyltransferase family 39 protein [Mangrovibacterium marinum]PTN08740.1 4-amino-4-deoxy-L-arabinose transferase-like glycosyltransferase [Mangrovibacterium marinum]
MKYFFLIGLFSVVLFFSFLGGTSVFQVAEARNAECAREMMENNELIVPTFNGELRTDKPALEYYGMMAGYYLFGVNERGARFFSALCGLLVVLATFWIARRHWGEKAAWWSALTLLASMHVIVQFRLATPDPYLILFHTLSIYFFYEGWLSRQWKWYVMMYVALGLGIFAKGPVGLLLPGFTFLLFMLFTKTLTWKRLMELKPWWGIFIVLLVAAPWYYAVAVKTGGAWTKAFFLEHNLNRFDAGLEGHRGSFLLPFLFLLAGLLPFSAFIFRALKGVWTQRKTNPLLLLAGLSALVVAVFYALSQTKLINYTSPAYPFLSLAIGYFVAGLPADRESLRKSRIETYAMVVLSLMLPVGVYFFVANTAPLQRVGWISWFLLLLPLGAISALVVRKASVNKSLTAIALAFMATTLIIFWKPLQVIDDQSPIQKYRALVHVHPEVVAYKDFDHGFAFYAQRRIPVFQTEQELEDYLTVHTDVLVLTRARDLTYMSAVPNLSCIGIDHDLFSRHSTGIYHQCPTHSE